MSVYTSVSKADLRTFLTHYAVGVLQDYEGILAGIENSNYFVTTDKGQYVLTLFEQYPAASLPFFLDLMHFWAKHTIPTARPIATCKGTFLSELHGKPAALVERLQGKHIQQANPEQCAAIGICLAKMHKTGAKFQHYRAPDRGQDWRLLTIDQLLKTTTPLLPPIERELLQTERYYQANLPLATLPQGVIHADLFRDNALFIDNQLTGVIDLYYACHDSWLYDLAVVVNDWCFTSDHCLDKQNFQALLGAYHQQRPLTPNEQLLGIALQRAAALRFWLSRLLSTLSPPQGELTFLKDPAEFRTRLQYLIATKDTITGYWQNLS